MFKKKVLKAKFGDKEIVAFGFLPPETDVEDGDSRPISTKEFIGRVEKEFGLKERQAKRILYSLRDKGAAKAWSEGSSLWVSVGLYDEGIDMASLFTVLSLPALVLSVISPFFLGAGLTLLLVSIFLQLVEQP